MPRLKTYETDADRFYRSYAEKIAGRMSYRRITIADVAKILNCSENTARKKLRNVSELSLSEAEAINRAFNLGFAIVDRLEGVQK